ncbi:MAG: recombination protein RecR [Nitrospinaceae bacterium]|jgi:recombination protein RecR|nr:recombination protein RecR [Nitrospinaceae bacterium]MBT3434252.1 recombination protein RecR [Nitrospinaceae bacterium]MBT3819953.1 recombination protein RecR [Nitrospinaceae bacterium]MBT4093712.1 recombination protein RecR [Nitrospinaceae bacterium]MBT4430517.1 recombination protein RecR [Nitrospinaceae bacterium]
MPLDQFPAIQECIDAFRRLPGIGPKGAQRIVFHLLTQDPEAASLIAEKCESLHDRVNLCERCHILVEGEAGGEDCSICGGRDPSVICVVQEPADVFSIERASGFRGRFHVLMGVISPLDGVNPEDLTIGDLIDCIKKDGVKEVILALNPNMAGEGTSLYLATVLKPFGVRVTQLAQGLPMGSHLEYADELTLSRSIEGRKEL